MRGQAARGWRGGHVNAVSCSPLVAPSCLPSLSSTYGRIGKGFSLPRRPLNTTSTTINTKKSRKKRKASSIPKNKTWKDIASRRKFLDELATRLGIKQPTDWYHITRKQIEKEGGKHLFDYYPSLVAAMKGIYPEVAWEETKFAELGRAPSRHWQDEGNLLKFLESAEKRLGIEKPEDWYTVTLSDLKELGFPGRVGRPKLVELLVKRYPPSDEFNWDDRFLLRSGRSLQRRLERVVRSLFKNEEVKVNSRDQLFNPSTGTYMELDIYIPSLHLAFECQEKHHYVSRDYSCVPAEEIAKRDAIKKDIAASKGISLIIVPFWWKGETNKLVGSIRKVRPDLLVEEGVGLELEEGIEEDIPVDALKQEDIPHISDIGQPLNATFFTKSTATPINWWMFEKYDGIRGFWNPLKRKFFSRRGSILPIPDHVIDSMPSDLFLDGEIWFGYGKFQEAMKVVQHVDPSLIDWGGFRYMVFDIPNHIASYQDRYNHLEKEWERNKWKYVHVAPKEVCKDASHIEDFFQSILDRGGEGIIVRNPLAEELKGRSRNYLKHKKFRDAEARVLASAGFNQWECELPNGVRFVASAGTKDLVKRNPQPGDIVSFKHHGYLLSSKKPKFPNLYRIRHDLTWDDLCAHWKENTLPPPDKLTARTKNLQPASTKAKGYWRLVENRKQLFIDYAQRMGFDPLNPDSWKAVTKAQFTSLMGSSVLKPYRGSLLRALLATFPEHFAKDAFTLRERKNNSATT